MTYTKSYTAWQDYPITSTPILASKLQNMDDGISTVAGSVTALSASTVALSAAVVALSGTTAASATDATLSFTDVTTNNSSTTKHGFLKKLSGVSTQYMGGDGNWTVPAVTGGSDIPTVILTSADVDITGVADCTSTINSALASVNSNRGGNVYLPQGLLYTATGLSAAIQGTALIGIEGHTGISDDLVKGSTQIIVGDGAVGLTMGVNGTQTFRGFRAANLHFYEKNAGMALGGLRILDTCDGYFERVAAGRFTTGYGIKVDSSNTATIYPQYNTFVDCRVGRCLYGYHQKAAIGTRWIAGQGDGGQNGVNTPLTNSIGFYIESGDNFRAIGTLCAGYATLFDLGTQIGHMLIGVRGEYWTTAMIRVRGGTSPNVARRIFLSGEGDNSLIGSLGIGVQIDSGAEDVVDMVAIENVAATTNRHVDNGTRSRFPSLLGATNQASVLGSVVGKQAVYDNTGALMGYTPLYDAITGISFVRNLGGATNNATSVTSVTRTLTAPANAGDWVIVAGGYGSTVTRTITVSDSASNTYTVDEHDDKTTANTPHSFVASASLATALSAGSTITVTFSGAVNYPIMYAYEFSGLLSPAIDAVSGGTAVSTTPSATVTTTAAYDLLMTSVYYQTGVTFTPGSGWTVLDEVGTTAKRIATMMKYGPTATSYTADGTLTGSTDWALSVATYKKA